MFCKVLQRDSEFIVTDGVEQYARSAIVAAIDDGDDSIIGIH